jgi:hypothetical protein
MPEVHERGNVIIRPTDENQIMRLKRYVLERKRYLGSYTEECLKLLFIPKEYFVVRLLQDVLTEGKVERGLFVAKIKAEFPEEYESGKSLFPKAWDQVFDLCDKSETGSKKD